MLVERQNLLFPSLLHKEMTLVRHCPVLDSLHSHLLQAQPLFSVMNCSLPASFLAFPYPFILFNQPTNELRLFRGCRFSWNGGVCCLSSCPRFDWPLHLFLSLKSSLNYGDALLFWFFFYFSVCSYSPFLWGLHACLHLPKFDLRFLFKFPLYRHTAPRPPPTTHTHTHIHPLSFPLCRDMILRFEPVSESPGGMVKQAADSSGLRNACCTSHKLPGDAEAAAPGTRLRITGVWWSVVTSVSSLPSGFPITPWDMKWWLGTREQLFQTLVALKLAYKCKSKTRHRHRARIPRKRLTVAKLNAEMASIKFSEVLLHPLEEKMAQNRYVISTCIILSA